MSAGRCEACAKDFKNVEAHNRLKHPPEEEPAEAAVAEAFYSGPVEPEPDGEPASWKGPRGPRMQPCSHEIKMLRPVCRTCEEEVGGKKYLAPLWFEECPHDPYVSYAEKPVQQPVYEPVDAENPNGPKRIVKVDTIVTIEPKPNWTSVTHGGGVNSGRGMTRALWKGFIYPQQLRSPMFPNGIKRRCQFRDCYAEDVKRYENGWFCREIEAKLVKLSDSEETFQVNFDRRSEKLQQSQLDKIAVRV